MRYYKTVFIIGVLLIVLPLLGVPVGWKSFLTAAAGVALVFVALSLRLTPASLSRSGAGEKTPSGNSFVENQPHKSSPGTSVLPEHHGTFPQN